MKKWLIGSLMFALYVPAVFSQAKPDKAGCSDAPLITRFPGAWIVGCKDEKFTSDKFPIDGKPAHEVIGERHRIDYYIPKEISNLEVQQNIMNALRAQGFAILAGAHDHGTVVANKGGTWYWASIRSGLSYMQIIMTEKQLEQQMVANADAIGSALNTNGHIEAKGILFDTGKADLKPESSAALDEIAKLLKQDASLKIYVVGHTDNQGQLASNMDLSKARAAAVVKELTTKYGIAASRLGSFGCGPYSPVASNDSEDGRAQNRRVELVKQ